MCNRSECIADNDHPKLLSSKDKYTDGNIIVKRKTGDYSAPYPIKKSVFPQILLK
jgi:hypothetical protein